MKETERRAIVWDTIERIAFRPASPKKWLGVYAKTLHKLWGMEPMWAHFNPDDNFSVTFLNLRCSYLIESADKYLVSLVNNSIDGHLYWQNHIDPGFLSKSSLHLASKKYPFSHRKHLQEDIKAVLDGLIFHPRCHVHPDDLGVQHNQLDPEIGGLLAHEIRIGGGIENPYVFLFHLRYQFCLVSDQVRQFERQRLIDLFERSIRTKQNVSAGDLFDYKR
jgi:hypothetical protein